MPAASCISGLLLRAAVERLENIIVDDGRRFGFCSNDIGGAGLLLSLCIDFVSRSHDDPEVRRRPTRP